MKFSEIANRLTGISTPLVGLSWADGPPFPRKFYCLGRLLKLPTRLETGHFLQAFRVPSTFYFDL